MAMAQLQLQVQKDWSLAQQQQAHDGCLSKRRLSLASATKC